MYPTCKSVLKGVCGKVSCRNNNGQKPCMISGTCNLQNDLANELSVTVNKAKVILVASWLKLALPTQVSDNWEMVCWNLHSWKKGFVIYWTDHQKVFV